MSRPLSYIKYETCLNSESRLYIGAREEYIGILPQEDKIVFKSLEAPKNVNKISLCPDCAKEKEVFQENIPQLTEMFNLIEELLEENKRLKQALGLA